MNRSFPVASLVSLVPLFALVACSAAPDEPHGAGSDPLMTSRLGGELCAYWYVDDDAHPRATGDDCSPSSAAFSARALDTSSSFESLLAPLGCKSARAASASPVTEYHGATPLNLTLCPDSCALWAAAAKYQNVFEVHAMTTKSAPTDCLVGDPAPGGWTYVVWDVPGAAGGPSGGPKCPSGCVHPE